MNTIKLKSIIKNKIIENDEEYLLNFIKAVILNTPPYKIDIPNSLIRELNSPHFHYWFYIEVVKLDKINILKMFNQKISILYFYLFHLSIKYDSVVCLKYVFENFMKDKRERNDRQYVCECFKYDSLKCYQYMSTIFNYKEDFWYFKIQLNTKFYPEKILKWIALKESSEKISQELLVLASIYYNKINLDDKVWRDILFNCDFNVSKDYAGIVDRLKTIVGYKKKMVKEVREEVRKIIMSMSKNEWYYVIPKDVLEVCLLEYI